MKKQIMTMMLALTVIISGMYSADAAPVKKAPQKTMAKATPKAAPKAIQKTREIKIPARPTPEQMNEIHQKKLQEMYLSLNLTEDQIKQSEQIKQASKEKMKPLIEKEKAKHKEIRSIRDNDDILIKVQDKKIEAIEAELKVIRQEIRQVKQDERKAFKALLTPEQKTKLEEIKKEKMNYRKPMKEFCPKNDCDKDKFREKYDTLPVQPKTQKK